MAAPDLQDVLAYLGTDTEYDEVTVTSAYSTERAAQAARCRVPLDAADWPADLAEALCRRVAVNLAKRNLPLGVSSSFDVASGFGQRFGLADTEVQRLEAPYRRLAVG